MKIKKVISCILAACMILGALSLQGISSVTGVAADGGVMRDNMTAQDYADEMGLGINLGNTMEAYDATNCESISFTWPPIVGENTPQDYERCWGAEITTQEIIDGMKNAGFNTVRIPVFWGNMMENDGKYKINDELIARVKEIVDYCRNAELYTVINIHHYDEFIIRRNSKEDCVKIFTNLWTQIANYFKDYSDYLVFEGYNEYLGGGQINPDTDTIDDMLRRDGYDWTNTLNQAFVDAVRATGGNNAKRLLIASGYWTNIDNTTNSAFKMPTDTVKDRLMVSVHYVDNNMYWQNQIGSDYWESYSLGQLELLKKAFYDKGIPVFVGETTTSTSYASDNGAHMAGNSIVNGPSGAMDYMLRLIKGYGFVPVLWDTNDNFYSRTECKIKSQEDEEIIKTLAEEIDNGTIQPPAVAEAFPKDDALAVVYWDADTTVVSGVADRYLDGATQIKYIFDCAEDVAFNSYTNVDLKANVAGIKSSTTVKGGSDLTGSTENVVTLPLQKVIKTGDSYSISMYTNSWNHASDYVFLIRCVKFLDTYGTVLKTIDKTNKPSSPTICPTAPPKTTRSAAEVAKDKNNAQKTMNQAKIIKLKAKAKGKKKIVVSWKKVTKAVGYEVQVAKNNKFKKVLVDKFTKNKKLTIKNPKIKSKKTYFVRVRAYATYNDKNNKPVNVYSKWIKKARKVKVK